MTIEVGTSSIQDSKGYNQVWKESLQNIYRAERRARAIISAMEVSPEKTVLEIGSGLGRTAFFLANQTGMAVTAIDICEAFIEKSRRLYQSPKLEYRTLDFLNGNHTSGLSYDYIIGNGILHHFFYCIDQVLVKLRTLLASGGKLIFWEPNLRNPLVYLLFKVPVLRRIGRLDPEEMAFDSKFILRKLEAADFREIDVQCRDFLLPNTPKCLIKPVTLTGAVFERLPVINQLAQSLFIQARKQDV